MTTLALPGRILPTGLELPEGLGFEKWQAIFERLKAAGRIETYRRREVLSFSHHAEVAALPPEHVIPTAQQLGMELRA